MGNRRAVVENNAVTTYSVNRLNQYTSAGEVAYLYDADGNLTEERGPRGVSQYSYDAEGRLSKAVTPDGTWEYEYDPFGNRSAVIRNGQRTELLVNPLGLPMVVGEYAADGRLKARYVQGMGLEGRIDAGGAASFYHFDIAGNTAVVSGQDGVAANRYSYLPFGELLSEVDAIDNPLTFAGQFGVRSDGHGDYFMPDRQYDPGLGRFTSPDPIGIGGGDANFRTPDLPSEIGCLWMISPRSRIAKSFRSFAEPVGAVVCLIDYGHTTTLTATVGIHG